MEKTSQFKKLWARCLNKHLTKGDTWWLKWHKRILNIINHYKMFKYVEQLEFSQWLLLGTHNDLASLENSLTVSYTVDIVWKWKSLSCVWLFATPWTVPRQVPLSMELSRQEYWSGVPFPPPGDLPNSGIKPRSPALREVSLLSEPPGKVNISLLCDSTISFLGIYSREIKVHVHRNLYTFVGNLLWP